MASYVETIGPAVRTRRMVHRGFAVGNGEPTVQRWLDAIACWWGSADRVAQRLERHKARYAEMAELLGAGCL